MARWNRSTLSIAAILVTATVSCSGPDRSESRDERVTLVIDADIITMDESNPSASSMAFRGDRILAIGSESEVRETVGAFTRVYDLDGRTVVPGFIETHDHLLLSSGTASITTVTPFETPTLAAALRRIANTEPDASGWVLAFGADQTLYEEREGPTRELLDQLFPENPVIVYHLSGHAAFVNSAALRLGGLDESSPDPVGGFYERDDTGRLTGYLSGQPAFLPLKPYPPPSAQTALTASRERAARGVTTASEFAIMNALVLDLLAEATSTPGFATRVVGGFFSTAPDYEVVAPILSEYENDLLSIPFVKTWTDGSPQGGTGLFTEGYHDESMGGDGAQGTQEYFDGVVRSIYEHGMWPAIHANGDGAIDVALHSVRAARESLGWDRTAGSRPQVIHAQLTRPEQIRRMADLGVSPTFFTTHVYYWGDLHYERTVGPTRAQRLSAMRDAFDAGIRPAMHNDPPVTPVDPIFNMWIAVNRRSSGGRILGSDQAITPYQALEAYTTNAAYQFGREHDLGSLEVGKLADFVVLDRNPLEVDPEAIREVRVLATVMGGRLTFSDLPAYDRVDPID